MRAVPIDGSRTATPRSILCSSGRLSSWSSKASHVGSWWTGLEAEQSWNNCWQTSEVRPTGERQGWELRTAVDRLTRRRELIMVTSPGKLSRSLPCSNSHMYGHAVTLSQSTGHLPPSSPAAYHEPYHTIKGTASCSASGIHFNECISLSLS